MVVARAKQIVAAILAAMLALAVVTLLFLVGQLVLRSGSGADPEDAFLEIPIVPERLERLVVWEPDQPLVREIEPDTRALVESAWVSSWQQITMAQRTGDRDGLAVWFLPGLAEHVAFSVGSDAGRAATIQQLAHDFEATFYSVDGSVMAVNITSEMVREIADGPRLRSIERYEAIFLLSDGNWRLQHLSLLPTGNG